MAELGFAIQGAGRKVVFTPPRAVSGKVVSIIKVCIAHLRPPFSSITVAWSRRMEF